jgi:hypothetical protein
MNILVHSLQTCGKNVPNEFLEIKEDQRKKNKQKTNPKPQPREYRRTSVCRFVGNVNVRSKTWQLCSALSSYLVIRLGMASRWRLITFWYWSHYHGRESRATCCSLRGIKNCCLLFLIFCPSAYSFYKVSKIQPEF